MHIKIYIPKTPKIESYSKLATKLFGGCTIIPNCRGFWRNDKNQIIKDEITILEAYIPKENAEWFRISQTAEYLALTVKRNEKQTCVAYCIDNEIYFV